MKINKKGKILKEKQGRERGKMNGKKKKEASEKCEGEKERTLCDGTTIHFQSAEKVLFEFLVLYSNKGRIFRFGDSDTYFRPRSLFSTLRRAYFRGNTV